MDPAIEDPLELSFTREELTAVFLLQWVDRLVMEPILEEYWEGLGVERMGEA